MVNHQCPINLKDLALGMYIKSYSHTQIPSYSNFRLRTSIRIAIYSVWLAIIITILIGGFNPLEKY
jgi:hypothetical protein